MSSRETRSRTARAIVSVAWVCTALSVFPLFWQLDAPWRPDAGSGESFSVLRTTMGETTYSSWGMTYEGRGGYWLRIGQIATIVAGAWLSTLRPAPLRWLGLVILLTWAGLWLVNGIRFSLLYPFWAFYAAAAFGAVFLVGLVARAALSPRIANAVPPA